MKYLVTGATGLIGSNICRLLIEQDDTVRALVRAGSDHEPLAAIGVELSSGDITDKDSVHAAADGCDVIINSAAVLGGNTQQLDEQRVTNIEGARNVFDAGAKTGGRVVTLSTTSFFRHDTPLTEESVVAADLTEDPYTRTKAAAYQEAMRRTAEEGADIVVVVPGGTFGPGLSVSRAMGPTSFNRLIRGALNGKVSDYLMHPVPWVLAEDVAAASIAAARLGAAGHKYLAFGQEDARSTAAFLNAACQLAGVEHRVADVIVDPADPDAMRRYGPTLVELAQRPFPVPWFDNRHTREQLGYRPRPLDEGLIATIGWLRQIGHVP